MRVRLSILVLSVLPVLILPHLSPAFAQQTSQSAQQLGDVSRRNLERAKQKLTENRPLDPQDKEAILAQYDEALAADSTSQRFLAQAARYERDRRTAPRLIESLEAALQGSAATDEVSLPESTTSAQIEQLLRKARAELSARRDAVRALQVSTQMRTERRIEIARRSGLLEQEIFDLDATLETVGENVNEPLLRQATIASLASRKQAALAEIRALDAELANYDARQPLTSLQERRADRRVIQAVQNVSQLENALATKSSAETAEYRSKLQQDCDQAVESYPKLTGLTSEILRYSAMLYGPDGVQARLSAIEGQSEELLEANATTRQVMELTRLKFEAVGDRADVQQWFPDLPSAIPARDALEFDNRQRVAHLADVQAILLGLQETRANRPDLDTELATLLASLRSPADETALASRESLVRRLLRTRRQLTDQLINEYSDYTARLQDLDAASKSLLRTLDKAYEFVLERVYWRRTVSGSLLPSGDKLLDAARWLFANPDWASSISRSADGAAQRPVVLFGLLGLPLLLLAGRSRLVQRLARVGRHISDAGSKAVRLLAESFWLTILLAAPLPLGILAVALFLGSPEPAPVAQKVSWALLWTAAALFLFEFVAQFYRPHGLAVTQFACSPRRSGLAVRNVRRWMLVALPAWLLCLSFGHLASDHVVHTAEALYVSTLGRVAFLIVAVATGVMSFHLRRVLKSDRQTPTTFHIDPADGLLLLGAASLLAALLSLLGLHLTGFVLFRTSLRSAAFVVLVVLATAFLDRLRQLRESQLVASESAKRREAEAGAEGHSDDLELEDQIIDVGEANRQVRRLVTFAAALVTLVGLYVIWSGILPSLRVLDQVQLLPVPKMLPASDAVAAVDPLPITDQLVGTSGQSQPADSQGAQEQGRNVEGAVVAIPGTQALSSVTPAPDSDAGWSFTLAGLLVAIAITLFTALLAKGVPGLLDFIFLSRLPLVGGDRKAFTTIASYVIVIIGMSTVASQLGLRWSQVQWLAAAFSFGLGFGLQDIFANFFSGLVLLFERPMRVGDFCRFGDQLGTVESIGLRSTRVRGLDRTVINVPNADFSKKELVNFAKRDRMLLKTVLGLRYETTDKQLRYVLAKIRQLLLSHPKVLGDPARARFVGYGDFSLNVELFAYVVARDWDEFLAIQEDIYLRIMSVVKESGTGFAFPSQTTYLARDEGLDEELTSKSEEQVIQWQSDNKLPFPDFTKRQKRRFSGSAEYPPVGSSHARSALDLSETEQQPPTGGTE